MIEINLRGVSFFVGSDENPIVRKGDFWESDILDYMARHHKKQGSILDIGAGIGNHSVYFANFLDYGSIMAFEPDKGSYDLLTKNMEPYLNVGLANVVVTNKTGPLRGVARMSIDKIAFLQVTLMRLGQCSEPEVIEGATDTIIRSRPLILIKDHDLAYHRLLMPLGYEIEQHWENHSVFLWRPV